MKILDITRKGNCVVFFLGNCPSWFGKYWDHTPIYSDIACPVDIHFVEEKITIYFQYYLELTEPRLTGAQILSKHQVYLKNLPLLIIKNKSQETTIFMGDTLNAIPTNLIFTQSRTDEL